MICALISCGFPLLAVHVEHARATNSHHPGIGAVSKCDYAPVPGSFRMSKERPASDISEFKEHHGKLVASGEKGTPSDMLSALKTSNLCASASSRLGCMLVQGAVSPAEVNPRERDVTNMAFAEQVDSAVIRLADIDRGAVFAQALGRFERLASAKRRRIRGFVINRFRGEHSLFAPGLEWLERSTRAPFSSYG